jgi:hypothetical protein
MLAFMYFILGKKSLSEKKERKIIEMHISANELNEFVCEKRHYQTDK